MAELKENCDDYKVLVQKIEDQYMEFYNSLDNKLKDKGKYPFRNTTDFEEVVLTQIYKYDFDIDTRFVKKLGRNQARLNVCANALEANDIKCLLDESKVCNLKIKF